MVPKKVAKILVSSVLDLGTMNPDTANILEYCVKILSGKEDRVFWNNALMNIDYDLWENEYSDGPGASYKNRSEEAYYILTQRFGYVCVYYRS